MLFQKCGNCTARFVVLFHAQRQRLGAAHDEPGVERRKNRARTVLNEADPVCILFIVKDYDAADAIGMTVEILGRRMDHDIDAKLERALQVWRHKRVVANYASARPMCDLTDLLQISNGHDRDWSASR